MVYPMVILRTLPQKIKGLIGRGEIAGWVTCTLQMHIAMSPVELASFLHAMLATVVIRKGNPLMIQHSALCVHKWQTIATRIQFYTLPKNDNTRPYEFILIIRTSLYYISSIAISSKFLLTIRATVVLLLSYPSFHYTILACAIPKTSGSIYIFFKLISSR